MEKRPLYEQIKETLLARLAADHWRPGELLPSEPKLAEEFDVSQGTVRRALDEMVRAVGADKLVLDLSCRLDGDGEYKVVTDRWQKWTDLAVDSATMERLSKCCDEFLVHGVDVEGMKLGIDLKLVELLGASCPIPVTYAGGVRSLEDLELVKAAGAIGCLTAVIEREAVV